MGRWAFPKSSAQGMSRLRGKLSRRFARVLAAFTLVLLLLSTMHGAGVSLAVRLFRARSPLEATMLHWFTGQLLPFANVLHFTRAAWTPFTCHLPSSKRRLLFCSFIRIEQTFSFYLRNISFLIRRERERMFVTAKDIQDVREIVWM